MFLFIEENYNKKLSEKVKEDDVGTKIAHTNNINFFNVFAVHSSNIKWYIEKLDS